MARFKNYLLVVIGFAVAGAIGAAFGTGTAQAVVSTLVTVVNPTGNPVQTQHVAADNPATQAISLLCSVSVSAPNTNGSCTLINGLSSNGSYVVPSGKRLVVESISGLLGVSTGQKAVVSYSVQDTQQTYAFYPPLNLTIANFFGQDDYAWAFSVKLYAEQGTSVSVTASTVASLNGTAYAFGHLENIQ
jgi:hypothetical protein